MVDFVTLQDAPTLYTDTGVTPATPAIPDAPIKNKVSILYENKKRKLDNLTAVAGLSPTDLQPNTYAEIDGLNVSTQNMVYNELAPHELNYVLDRMYKEYGVTQGKDGFYTANADGTYSKFEGDPASLASLYLYGTKDGNIKYGTHGGTDPSGRYTDEALTRYGEPIGPLGVDRNNLIENRIMPYDKVRLAEGLIHGNRSNLQQRIVKDPVGGNKEDYRALKALYGSGATEVYNPSIRETTAPEDFDREALWTSFNERFRLAPGMQISEEDDIRAINEKYGFGASSGLMGRLANTAKGAGATAVTELLVNSADLVTELASDAANAAGFKTNWDLGTEEEKVQMVNNLFGYDDKYAEEALKAVKGNVTNIYNAVKNGDDIEFGDITNILKETVATPELIGTSIGGIFALMVGFGKFTKIGKEVKGIEAQYRAGKISKEAAKAEIKATRKAASLADKTKELAANNVGFVAVTAGHVNDAVEKFSANNNGDVSMNDIIRITAVEAASAALDRFSGAIAVRDIPGLRTFTSKPQLKAMQEIAADATKSEYIRLAKKALPVLSGLGSVAKTSGLEAGTEYAQSLAEIFNEQYATQKYGSDAWVIITNEETQLDALTGAAVGFGTGGQMDLAGKGINAVKSGIGAVVGSSKRTAAPSQEMPSPIPIDTPEVNRRQYNEALNNLNNTMRSEAGFDPAELPKYLEQIELLRRNRFVVADAPAEKLAAADAMLKEAETRILQLLEGGKANEVTPADTAQAVGQPLITPSDDDIHEYYRATSSEDAPAFDVLPAELQAEIIDNWKKANAAQAVGQPASQSSVEVTEEDSTQPVAEDVPIVDVPMPTEEEISAYYTDNTSEEDVPYAELSEMQKEEVIASWREEAREAQIKSIAENKGAEDNRKKFDMVASLATAAVSKYGDSIPEDTMNKLRNFAKANKISAETLDKIIKSQASVEIEATIGDRGVDTRRRNLRLSIASGTATDKDIQRQYDEIVSFHTATLSSLNALKEGISKAENIAKTNNSKKFTVSTAPINVETGYKTDVESSSKGAPFVIVVSRNSEGTWVAHTQQAKDRIEDKTRTSKAQIQLISEFHQTADKYLDPNKSLSVGGYVVTSTTAKKNTGASAEASYVAAVKDSLGGVTINKVTLGEGKNKQWEARSRRAQANAAITNTLARQQVPYSPEDVVYLHTTGTITTKKGVKLSELYAKTGEAAAEIDAATQAGATIVLANDHRVGATAHGANLAKVLKSKGYIPFGVSSVERNIFVPDNETNAAQLATKIENRKAEEESEKVEAAAKAALVDAAIELKAHGLVDGGKSLEELEAAYNEAKEKVKPYFSELALKQAIRSAQQNAETADTAVEEVDVTTRDTVVEDDVDTEATDTADEATTSQEYMLDDALLAMRVSDNIEANISSYVTNSLKSVTTAGKAAAKSAEARGVVMTFSSDSLEALVNTSAKADADAGAVAKSAIDAWKDAKALRLQGNELLGALNESLKEYGQKVAYSNAVNPEAIVLGQIGKDILGNSVGTLAKSPSYIIRTEKFDSHGDFVGFGEYAAFKDHGYVVGQKYKGNEREKVLSISEIVHNPNQYVAATSVNPLNTFQVSELPQVFKDVVASTKKTIKKVVPGLRDDEKGMIASEGNDKSGLFWTLGSPARTLLFDTNGKVHDTVALAIGVSVRAMLATDKRKLMIGPKTKEHVAAMFGVHESQVNPAMIAFASKHGAFAKSMADSVGKGVLRALGLSASKVGEVNMTHYERLVADLGNIALHVAAADGLIELKTEESNDLAKLIKGGEVRAGDDGGATTLFVSIPSVQETDKDTGALRRVPSKKPTKAIEEYTEIDKMLPDVTGRLKEPFYDQPPSKGYQARAVSTIRNDRAGAAIPQKAKKALKGYMNTAYEMNIEGVDNFLEAYNDPERKDQVLALLGYIPIDGKNPAYASLLHEAKQIQEATNEDIIRSIEHLQNLRDKIRNGIVSNKMYFGFYYTSNQRFNIDSTTINPQSNKLHRFFIQPQAHKVTYKVNREKNTFEYRYIKDGNEEVIDSSLYVRAAVAQAFGIGIDKEYTEQIIVYGNHLLALSPEQVEQLTKDYLATGKMIINIEGTAKEFKPDHPSHALQALEFIKTLNSSKGDEITSSLSLEIDALTSGFANKVQQFGTLKDLTTHANRVGVLRNVLNNSALSAISEGKGKGINDLLADKTRLDSYKNLASITITQVGRLKDELKPSARNLFTALQPLLPGGKLVGQERPDIDSALRNLFKPAFMIFNYSAGINRIVKNLGEEVVTDLLAKIAAADLKSSNKPEDIATREAAEALAMLLPKVKGKAVTAEAFQAMLRDTPLKSITVAIDKFGSSGKTAEGSKKLMDYLVTTLISPTYGTAVSTAFETEFADFIEIQDTTNDMFKQSFAIFNQLLLEQVKAFKKAGNKVITEAKLKEFIDELRDVFPVIAGPLSAAMSDGKAPSDGVHVYDTDVSTPNEIMRIAPSPQARINTPDGVRQKKMNPLVRSLVAAANAGAVLPFHAIDGAQLTNATLAFIEEYIIGNETLLGVEQTFKDDPDSVGSGIVPIHDAVIAPLPLVDVIGFLYNRETVDIHQKYSIMQEIVKMADRAKDAISNPDSKYYVKPSLLHAPASLSIFKDKTLKDAKAAVDSVVKTLEADLAKAKASKASKEETDILKERIAEAKNKMSFTGMFNMTYETLQVAAKKVEMARANIYNHGTKIGAMVGLEGSVYTVGESKTPDLTYLEKYTEDYTNAPSEDGVVPVLPQINELEHNGVSPALNYADRVIGVADGFTDKNPQAQLIRETEDKTPFVQDEVVLVVVPESRSKVMAGKIQQNIVKTIEMAREALAAGSTLIFGPNDEMNANRTGLSVVFNALVNEEAGDAHVQSMDGVDYVFMVKGENTPPATERQVSKTSDEFSGNIEAIDVPVISESSQAAFNRILGRSKDCDS